MKRHEIDMLNGSLGDKILMVALPLAATGILQQLFNAADIAVVGRFAGTTAMAAVGSNSPVIGLLVNLFTGISLGTNVVIARRIGAGDKKGIHDAVHTSVLLAVLGGLLLMLLGQLIVYPLLGLLSVPAEVLPGAVLYLRIYLIGLPVIFLYNFESAILRSRGNTSTPLVCLTISGILNVFLNLFFVLVMKMTVEGVALATVLSNLVSSGLLFLYLLRDTGDLHVEPKDLKISRDVLSDIARIGLPAGLQGMIFSISNLCVQSAINSLGAAVMAGSAAAFNVEIIAYYVVNSFSQAATTFIGQNYGARKPERCLRVVRLCLLQGNIFAVAMAVVILLTGNYVLGFFNEDPAVINAGLIRIHYILLFEPADVFMEVLSGVMRGFGNSLPPAILTLICVCGSRILWVNTVFRMHPDFPTLMTIYPLSWIVTSIALIFAYFHMKNHALASFFGKSGRDAEKHDID